MVESSLSVVVLCACFSLIFWQGLITRKLTRVRRSFYTGWLYFPETPYVSCALQNNTHRWNCWIGMSQPLYTAAFCLFFLFVGIETLLNQHLERLTATNELKFFVFVDFALWVIFFVIGYVDGTIWAETWPSTRIVGFALILSYPFVVVWPPTVLISVYMISAEPSSSTTDSLYSTQESRIDLRKRGTSSSLGF